MSFATWAACCSTAAASAGTPRCCSTTAPIFGHCRSSAPTLVARLVDRLAQRASELGAVTQLVHTAGLSPAQASAEAVLRVDLLGVVLVLDAFGKIISRGGAGIVVASMAGYLFRAFATEQKRALAHTAGPELLSLPYVSPDTVTDSALADGLAKRANHIRVQAASMAWGRHRAIVNSISPGCIAIPMGHRELDSPIGEGICGMVAASAAGRSATGRNVSAAGRGCARR